MFNESIPRQPKFSRFSQCLLENWPDMAAYTDHLEHTNIYNRDLDGRCLD